ncbi:unnamed protein product [Merluccius merluccius]
MYLSGLLLISCCDASPITISSSPVCSFASSISYPQLLSASSSCSPPPPSRSLLRRRSAHRLIARRLTVIFVSSPRFPVLCFNLTFSFRPHLHLPLFSVHPH